MGAPSFRAIQEARRLQHRRDRQLDAAREALGRAEIEDPEVARDLVVGHRTAERALAELPDERARALASTGRIARHQPARAGHGLDRDLLGGLAHLIGQERRHRQRRRVVVEAVDLVVGSERHAPLRLEPEQIADRVVVLGAAQAAQHARPGRPGLAAPHVVRARRLVAHHLADERGHGVVLRAVHIEQHAARMPVGMTPRGPGQQDRRAVHVHRREVAHDLEVGGQEAGLAGATQDQARALGHALGVVTRDARHRHDRRPDVLHEVVFVGRARAVPRPTAGRVVRAGACSQHRAGQEQCE